MRPHSLVASPSAIGSTPLASGSSVPPWPTFVFGSPPWRRMRLTALTAVVEPSPTGLSRMIQPWSTVGALLAVEVLRDLLAAQQAVYVRALVEAFVGDELELRGILHAHPVSDFTLKEGGV